MPISTTEHRFGRDEKLKSKKVIQHLFDEGSNIKVYPLMIFYSFQQSDKCNIRVGFSVSKKKFKRAVDRNRIKRMMRETYRLNKSDLHEVVAQSGQSLNIMMIYLQNSQIDYDKLNLKMKEVIGQLCELNNKQNG